MDFKISVEPQENTPEIRTIWHNKKIPWSQRMQFYDDANTAASAIGDLILKPEIITAALGAVGGWLAAKQGRKIRLKVEDIEIEATSIEELEAMMKLADEYSNRSTAEDQK